MHHSPSYVNFGNIILHTMIKSVWELIGDPIIGVKYMLIHGTRMEFGMIKNLSKIQKLM